MMMISHAIVSSMSAVGLAAPRRCAGAERCTGVLISAARKASVSQGLIEMIGQRIALVF